MRILYVSYNVDVARGKSAAVKNLVGTPEFREVFPNVKLSKNKTSDELWAIDWDEAGVDVRGEDAFTLACAGLKGSITSKRSSLVVVDDAIKSANDIRNPDIRREMEGNWESVIVPTLFQGGRAIALGTRFHFDDIFATMFCEKKGWQVMTQSALSYDEDGRPRSYWPSMWSVKYLLQRQAANRISFSYQYQNQPIRNTELGISPELFVKGDVPDSFDTINPLSPPLRSLQRRPQAPHAKSKFLAITGTDIGASSGLTLLDQDWIESLVPPIEEIEIPAIDPPAVSIKVISGECQVTMNNLIPGKEYTLLRSLDCKTWETAETFTVPAADEADQEEEAAVIPESRIYTETADSSGRCFYCLKG